MSKNDGRDPFHKQSDKSSRGTRIESLDTPDIDFSYITDVPFQRTYSNLADIETPEPLIINTPNLINNEKTSALQNLPRGSGSDTSSETLLDLSQRTANQHAQSDIHMASYGQGPIYIHSNPSLTSTITSMSTSTSVSHSESSESTIEFPDFYSSSPSTPAYLQPYKLNPPEQFRRHSIATTAGIPVFTAAATVTTLQYISSDTMPAHFSIPSAWNPKQYGKQSSSKRMHPYLASSTSTTSTVSIPSSSVSVTTNVPSIETTSSDSNTYIDLIEFKPKVLFDESAKRRGSFDTQTASAARGQTFETFMSSSSNPPFQSTSDQTEELINFDNLFVQTPTASTSMGRQTDINRDFKYYEFRHKNNIASKKFRCSQRDKQKFMDKQIQFYIKDNKKCVELIAKLEKEIEICKKILFKNFKKSDSPEKQ